MIYNLHWPASGLSSGWQRTRSQPAPPSRPGSNSSPCCNPLAWALLGPPCRSLNPTLPKPKGSSRGQEPTEPGGCNPQNHAPGTPPAGPCRARPNHNKGTQPRPQRQAPRDPTNQNQPSTPEERPQTRGGRFFNRERVKPIRTEVELRRAKPFARKPCPTVSDVRTTEVEKALCRPHPCTAHAKQHLQSAHHHGSFDLSLRLALIFLNPNLPFFGPAALAASRSLQMDL